MHVGQPHNFQGGISEPMHYRFCCTACQGLLQLLGKFCKLLACPFGIQLAGNSDQGRTCTLDCALQSCAVSVHLGYNFYLCSALVFDDNALVLMSLLKNCLCSALALIRRPGAWSGLRLSQGEAFDEAASKLSLELAEAVLNSPPYEMRWMLDHPRKVRNAAVKGRRKTPC